MLVSDVLRAKGTRLITIEPDATIVEAIARMVQNNIGSLPVTDSDGHLIGIFSERDVLRGIHNRGETFGKAKVREVMTAGPITCPPGCDVEDVMGMMSDCRIAKVPVVDGKRLVGIISVGDVIKHLYERVASENQHLMCYIHGTV